MIISTRDSLHVLFNELAMVILDLLVTVPMEVESVHMVMGQVGQATLLECDLGRWWWDVFVAVLVVVRGGASVVVSKETVSPLVLTVMQKDCPQSIHFCVAHHF